MCFPHRNPNQSEPWIQNVSGFFAPCVALTRHPAWTPQRVIRIQFVFAVPEGKSQGDYMELKVPSSGFSEQRYSICFFALCSPFDPGQRFQVHQNSKGRYGP